MLNFFTDPYPNELLYSILSRYQYYFDNNDTCYAYLELCGSINKLKKMYYANYIKQLVEKLGGTYSAKELLYNHTILPYYQFFLTEDKLFYAIRNMKNDNLNLFRSKLLSDFLCLNKQLYYCPKCVLEDVEKFGEAYLHREHQLEGILICPIHKVNLKPFNKSEKCNNYRNLIRLDSRKVDLTVHQTFIELELERLWNISKLSYELFTCSTKLFINKEILVRYYREKLYEKGFMNHSGVINLNKLKKELIKYYGVEVLSRMNSSIDLNGKKTWVDDLLEKNHEFAEPIKHLILISFLGKNINEVINDLSNNYKPFGEGPWLCLNEHCSHYNNKTIEEFETIYDKYSDLPAGVFKCNICGFTYKRFYYNFGAEEIKIGQIFDYGTVWKEKLKKYAFHDRLSIEELADKMDCDIYTVIEYLEELNIKEYNELIKRRFKKNKLEKYKMVLAKKIKASPNIGKIDLAMANVKEYKYVRTNDFSWLNDNLPELEY